MAHDFAKQRAARSGRSGRTPATPWAWLFSGIAIGATFSFLVYLAMLKTPVPPSQAGQADAHATTAQPRRRTKPAPEPEPQGKPEPQATTAARPQFDFYDILRDNDAAPTSAAGDAGATAGADTAPPVEVPEPPATAPVASASAAPPAAVTAPAAAAPGDATVAATPAAPPSSALALQAGAFSRAADADRRRGELLLLGYDAKVETVRLPDGQTRYRVQVGPFADPQAQSNARRALRDVGIETL